MKSKIIMTSMVGLAFAMPAIATPSNTSNTFPSNGQMQEDYTYVGQATQTNLHSYEGPVRASANYTNTPYTVTAGNYLPMSSETVAPCTSGNYCPGISGTVNYSTSSNQGLTECPSGYPNSLAGATSNTECYTACTVANAGIAHASAVSGNDYYGTGTDTCEPTACENGYHLKAGAPNLEQIIGNTYGTQNYNNEAKTFSVTYADNKGSITGKAQCSTRSVTNLWYDNGNTFASDHFATTLPDNTGINCYCMLDSYTPENGTSQTLSTPWVFMANNAGSKYYYFSCDSMCAEFCANHLASDNGDNYLAFRGAMFGTIQSSPASCDANVISITWDGADQTDIDANNAGQCTYGGDINTPKKAVHVPGKTFVGWTFDTPSGN